LAVEADKGIGKFLSLETGRKDGERAVVFPPPKWPSFPRSLSSGQLKVSHGDKAISRRRYVCTVCRSFIFRSHCLRNLHRKQDKSLALPQTANPTNRGTPSRLKDTGSSFTPFWHIALFPDYINIYIMNFTRIKYQ